MCSKDEFKMQLVSIYVAYYNFIYIQQNAGCITACCWYLYLVNFITLWLDNSPLKVGASVPGDTGLRPSIHQ